MFIFLCYAYGCSGEVKIIVMQQLVCCRMLNSSVCRDLIILHTQSGNFYFSSLIISFLTCCLYNDYHV